MKDTRIEAVKLGVAQWTADKDGTASFSWIIPKGEK